MVYYQHWVRKHRTMLGHGSLDERKAEFNVSRRHGDESLMCDENTA